MMKKFDMQRDSEPVMAIGSSDAVPALADVEKDIRGLMHRLGKVELDVAGRAEQSDAATRKTLLALLAVSDSFENVFSAVQRKEELVTPQMKKWLGNFRTTYRLLHQVLLDLAVTRIEDLGGVFDPHCHTVAERVADPAKPEGSIVRTVAAGYLWRNAVLRKAEVVVSVSSVLDGGRPPDDAQEDIGQGA